MHFFKKIFEYGRARLAAKVSTIHGRSISHAGNCPILYGLNSPQYLSLKFGEINLFSGCVLSLTEKKVTELIVSSGDNLIGAFPVNKLRNEIAQAFPKIPSAKTCGFDFELYIGSAELILIFHMVFDDGSTEFLFNYDLSYVRQMHEKITKMERILENINLPDGALVCLTQGHRDAKAYFDSIIPFILDVRRYLEHCGADIDHLRTILDFGCGSGRALLGWYADDPSRNLFGCDINDELISWAKINLPRSVRIDKTLLKPPLPYSSGSIDMIQLISVFTHLGLETQKIWIEEFQRILKPGGYLLVTLHGELYVRLSEVETHDYTRVGYCESSGAAEGSNEYATFHSLPFVERLFENFEILGYFPAGMIGGERLLFQIASQQDVYLLRYSRSYSG